MVSVVSNFMMVNEILDHLCQQGLVPLHDRLLRTHTLHMSGLQHHIYRCETIADLQATVMTYFYLCEHVIGGGMFSHYQCRFVMLTERNIASSDACALDKNGKLKDASEIDWYEDGDDAVPLNTAGPSTERAGT